MITRALKRTGTLAVLVPLAGAAVAVQPASAAPADGPSNIIVLISDGAGYNQFDIASLYEAGQSYQQVTVDPATGAIERVPGEPTQVYEHYPVRLGTSHHSASGRAAYVPEDAWGDFRWVASGATDSAAAATALGTGVKTNNGVIGYTPDGERLLTVGEQALEVGKKVGLVTNVTFNHATPAGFIAHNQNRNDYHGLATEMIDSGIDVLIGAGHPNFTDDNTSRPSHFGSGSWISAEDFARVSTGQTPFTYVERRADFERIADGTAVPDKLFGLLQVAETSQYNRAGLGNDDVLPFTDPFNDVPSLATLTRGALNVLDQGEDGFFLMVEGGAVDWAGHANQTTRVIEEQIDFNEAVEAVDAWVESSSSWDETLVIVTADHETGYLAGAGAGPDAGWTPLTGEAGALPDVSWHSGGHTNALVPIFAKGAGSELLEARAGGWDVVRGAYLDNTDIGKTVFDLIGHAPVSGENAVALQASVPLGAPAGNLSLTVADRGPVVFAADDDAASQQATLPEVTVDDSRNEVQARGNGWTVSGTARDFAAGNRSFGADNLRWDPRIVSTASGATAGGTATLETPSTLADADRLTRVGSTVVSADLGLTIPAEVESGRYGSQITLTLFAKD